jgi:hypothetical protein
LKPSTTPHLAAPHDERVGYAQQARTLALYHGEKILIEIPRTLRRFRQFMFMMNITIPLFLAGLLVVLWHLAG